MKTIRLAILVGLIGIGGLATGCDTDQAENAEVAALKAELAASQTSMQQMDAAMVANYEWMLRAAEAICQLEKKSPAGLDPDKRICPGSPPDLKPPPQYPLP